MADIDTLRRTVYALKDAPINATARGVAISAIREIPKTAENVDVFTLALEIFYRIENSTDRGIAILDLAREVPYTQSYQKVYHDIMEAAITAADELEEAARRVTELQRLASELPKTKEFEALRVRAWRLVLSLPDKPHFRDPNMDRIAKELPKNSDLMFYRRYTLMGVIATMPRDEEPFTTVYRQGIELAIRASGTISEPFYRKYALMYIARDLTGFRPCADLLRQVINESYRASLEMTDPFPRQYAIIELIREIPRTEEYFPLLQEALDQALSFFTVKKWMEDVEVLDIVDYILSAEDAGINDSKKRRFTREKYSDMLASILLKFGEELNDIRFIETLEPYTHVWVQPKELRDAVRKVVEGLEKLKNTYHGREITRPLFVKEEQLGDGDSLIHEKDAQTSECVSIDLGATNTVIMRKKGQNPPEFVHLPDISRKFENMFIVPTVLSPDTNTIGTAVIDDNPITDLKQMLLDNNPRGKAYMERFFKVLYQHLKKATFTSGWLFSKNPTDVLYITVPVGYQDYRETMREIAGSAIKGSKAEFIEEPLAAAVGYEVVDENDKVIMVVDFGGSTLNTMIVRLNMNEVHVIAKPERAQILGGHDIDVWLAEHLAEKASIPCSGEIPYKLLVAAEEIKIELSRKHESSFTWDGRLVDRVTRQEFEELLDKHEFYKIVDRTMSYVLRRAEKVGLKKDRIEAVLLTGGSSQIPSFKDKIGHVFPNLRRKNLIYDHSPLSAVGLGAALYGTRDISDRHLGMAYALRYATDNKEQPYAYSIVLEKGETLPLEKTFRINPAKKLSTQNEISLELFEVPESLISRRWVMESGIEFIKQELAEPGKDVALKNIKTVSLPFGKPVDADVIITLCLSQAGDLSVKYGDDGSKVEAGIRLQ